MASSQEKKPTLSLCMIVKNEEENLERCLESIEDVIDEIIIVDTGSKDDTKEIAERFNAKIYDFEWNDDFSDARNFSLEKATSDWILVLDADEELDSDSVEKLSEAIDFENGLANLVFYIDYINGVALQTLKTRIFKNLPEIRFDGQICENVYQSLIELSKNNPDFKTRVSSVYINHLSDLDFDEGEKQQRNLDSINRTLDDFSLSINQRVYYLLKKAWYLRAMSNDPTEVVNLMNQAFSLTQKPGYRETPFEPEGITIFVYLIGYLLQIEKYDEAKGLIDKVINYYPNSLNLLCAYMKIAIDNDQDDLAIKYLVKCKYLIDNNSYFKYEELPFESIENTVSNLLIEFEIKGFDVDSAKENLIEAVSNQKNNNIEHSFNNSEELDVSLCIIVNNNAVELEKALPNIYKIFKEIIVVDIGDEKDETIEFAGKYGCSIYNFDWDKDDYSKINNFALEKVNSTWALFFEPNEILESESINHIKVFLDNPKISGININILEYEDEISSENLVEIKQDYRLFKKNENIFFEEKVFPSVKKSLEIDEENNDSIVLEQSQIVIKKLKPFYEPEHYLRVEILDSVLENLSEPSDKVGYVYQKAILYKELNEIEFFNPTIIEAYDLIQGIEKNLYFKYPFINQIYYEIIDQVSAGKNYLLARNLALEAIRFIPNDYRFYYLAGKHFFKLGNFQNAKVALNDSLIIIDRTPLFDLGTTTTLKEDKSEINALLNDIKSNYTEKPSLDTTISFYTVVNHLNEVGLKKCLESVKDYADQLLIISSKNVPLDKLEKVASNYSAKVIVSETSNLLEMNELAIKNCNKKLILKLEPYQEIMSDKSELFEDINYDSNIICHIFDEHNSDNLTDLVYKYNLFKREADLSFSLPLADSLSKSVKENVDKHQLKVKRTPISIINNKEYLLESISEQVELLDNYLKQDLDLLENISILTKKANLLYISDKNAFEKFTNKVIHLIKKFKDIDDDFMLVPSLCQFYYDYACFQFEKGLYGQVIETCDEGLIAFPKAINLSYQKALAQFESQDYEGCIETFIECVDLGSYRNYYKFSSHDPGYLNYKSLYKIGVSYLKMDKKQLAKLYFRQALEEKDDYEPAEKLLSELEK